MDTGMLHQVSPKRDKYSNTNQDKQSVQNKTSIVTQTGTEPLVQNGMRQETHIGTMNLDSRLRVFELE